MSESARSELQDWLGLAIGNSHLHWAWFSGNVLQHTWNTDHFSPKDVKNLIAQQFDFRTPIGNPPIPFFKEASRVPPFLRGAGGDRTAKNVELWIASVVPDQTSLWQSYPFSHVITTKHIPLQDMYPGFGVDRALALWGAIEIWGSPTLVIDAGTALTFTGADEARRLVGGAILPGLQLQFRALGRSTAALPLLESQQIQQLPERWASNTEAAIASGVVYTALAGLRDFVENWWQRFPASSVIVTGGDSEFLHTCLTIQAPELATGLKVEPELIFGGMQAIRGRMKDEIFGSATD